MSVRTHHKLVGIAGAAVLAVGVLGGSAVAAGSTASASYTCATPIQPVATTIDYSVAAVPAKLAVGQPVKTTATITLDAASTALAEGIGWVTFSGTIDTSPSASKAGLSLKFPSTTLGNGAGGTTVANATGSVLAGTKTGTFHFELGNLGKVVLNGKGTPSGQFTFPSAAGFGQCSTTGTTDLMQSTKVVKDSTTTKATAKYTAGKKSAAATATVKAKYGTTAAGKVSFTLKKGSKTVKTMSGTLKKGKASVTFKNVKAKGSYSVTTKYAGSSSLNGSSGKKVTFKVK